MVYPEKKAVGVQFVDPEGGHIFITIPGAMLPLLAAALNKIAEDNPEVSAWQPAPYATSR
ncbi:MAG: hypothetical protein ACREIP_01060 [Alphaproteobacteria bacterium]